MSYYPSGSNWQPTPVEHSDSRRWHLYDHDPQVMSAKRPQPHGPTIREYLEKYGAMIPIEMSRDEDANRAIQSEGSFYSYAKGGRVMIVDPARGKVYVAYAG